jgi:DNA-binding transcriptional MerR regulator
MNPAVPDTNVEIPNRAAFKASEVCEIAQIPSYVLRSWEKEFPRLGASARPGGPRIYNRGDVEQILRIKQLVFSEGLTLAGARRRLEGDPPAEEEPVVEGEAEAVPGEVLERVAGAKRELRSLLELLSQPASTWPPRGAASTPASHAPVPAEDDPLPLIDGVPDSPAKPRRAKRSSKEGRGGTASNVE